MEYLIGYLIGFVLCTIFCVYMEKQDSPDNKIAVSDFAFFAFISLMWPVIVPIIILGYIITKIISLKFWKKRF